MAGVPQTVSALVCFAGASRSRRPGAAWLGSRSPWSPASSSWPSSSSARSGRTSCRPRSSTSRTSGATTLRPSASWNLFGTDAIGGTCARAHALRAPHQRASALAATAMATIIGVALGSIAGYRGGWLDVVIMRICDLLGVFPLLVIFLAVYAYFTPVTAWKATFALTCFLWIPVARVVRAEMASIRSGSSSRPRSPSEPRTAGFLLFCHLLPSASGTIIIAATALLAQVFVLEALLDFFGLGVSTATAEHAREPDRRGRERRLRVGRGLVGVGLHGGGAPRHPDLHESVRRRRRRGSAPAHEPQVDGAATSAPVESPVRRPSPQCRLLSAGR